jgi:hypothetical protein
VRRKRDNMREVRIHRRQESATEHHQEEVCDFAYHTTRT